MKKNIFKKLKYFQENGINREFVLKLILSLCGSLFLYTLFLGDGPQASPKVLLPKNHQALQIHLKYPIDEGFPITGHVYESEKLIAENIIIAKQIQETLFLAFVPNDQLSDLLKVDDQSTLSFFTVRVKNPNKKILRRKLYEVIY